MPRKLRIQDRGSRYHLINRGNYRSDVFATDGARESFEVVLAKACQRYQWELHAFVLMTNHYHLVLTTEHPNLGEGMHWLQTTYAVRFNRFRNEQGHVFKAVIAPS